MSIGLVNLVEKYLHNTPVHGDKYITDIASIAGGWSPVLQRTEQELFLKMLKSLSILHISKKGYKKARQEAN